MAHLRCDFRSDVLDMITSMTVVLPDGADISLCPVVYVFHGFADNCTGISRYTSVERYARDYGAVLIIPEVQHSFYADMEKGLLYFRFIHDELPEICGRLFKISCNPAQTYLMGLSMGGYGGLKCLFNSPLRYAGAAMLSSVADISEYAAGTKGIQRREFEAIFGSDLIIPENCDLMRLAEKCNISFIPKIYMACGEQDELFPANKRLSALLESRGADVCFEHWEGIHNWAFWDCAFEKAFRYLLSKE